VEGAAFAGGGRLQGQSAGHQKILTTGIARERLWMKTRSLTTAALPQQVPPLRSLRVAPVGMTGVVIALRGEKQADFGIK
jgi:hypothetical protein